MSLDPAWRPAEDNITIINERTWLAGMILAAVAYGVAFTLFVLTFRQLVKTTTKYNYTQRLPFIIYVTLMLILGTLFVGAIAKMTELSFIDYRLFPGGPAAFEELEFSIPIDEISNVSYVIANWLADGMVIYRFLVIFRNTRLLPLWVVMFIPVLAYMASFSLSVVWLIQVSAPASSPWSNVSGANAINFTGPYFWMSLSLNISMTVAICARLIYYRKRIASVFGANHGTQYTSVAAMIVESAALYSAFALLFLIPFALNNPIQNAFIQLMGEIQIVATLLITYRVAHGAAWAHETSQAIFGTRDTQATQRSGVRVQVEFSGPHEIVSSRRLTAKLDSPSGEHEMEKYSV
jgi:hypothetical protein